MEFRTHFRHMATSPATADYAAKKLVPMVETYTMRPTQLSVTFAVEGDQFLASCHLNGSHLDLHVSAQSTVTMNSAVDQLQEKLEECLRRRKERLTHHKVKNSDWETAKPESAATRDDSEEFDDFEERVAL